MTRRFLRQAGRALIWVVLFSQMAIAVYACPTLLQAGGMTTTMQAPSTTDDAQAMPCGDMAGMADPAAPNLCAEHCRYGQQSDHASTLTLPAVLLTTLPVTPYADQAALRPPRSAMASTALAAADPPHAILHCCLRT